MPPLVIEIGNHLRKKVLAYSDASFAKKHDDNTVRNGLVVIVVDCKNGRAYRSNLPCPAWLLNLDRKTQIVPLELLAVLCAALTFPEVIKDRQCVFLIDNMQALSACIHGYCRNTDMNLMCNPLHLSFAGLRCQPFFNWVPTKAIPSGQPSREDGAEQREIYKLL